MKKKVLSILLVIAMLLSLIPVAFAAEEPAATTRKNLAENGDFEQVEEGQFVGINACDGWNGTKISVETEEVYEGNYALKMTSNDTYIPGSRLLAETWFPVQLMKWGLC